MGSLTIMAQSLLLIFGIDNGICVEKGWIYQNDIRSQMKTIVILITSVFQAGSVAMAAFINEWGCNGQ
jgi:hypothetical protein